MGESTLKRWGLSGQLAGLGLRYCPHGQSTKALAAFEDLLFNNS
jgi:hypothetical protein